MKLAISGATGRMGLSIIRLARASSDIQLVGGSCGPDDPNAGRDLGELSGGSALGVVASPDVGSALLGADVVIDFSVAGVVQELAARAAREKVAVVSGTTNLDANALRALDRAAEVVPVMWAPNMSLGVQVLAELVQSAIEKLGADFDVEIVELHHKKKVDSPSGTARRLAEVAKSARGGLREIHGRDGNVGARPTDEIAVFGVRGGDVVGEHTVYLLGPGERIELSHRATSRELFAHGALRAARFLAGKPPKRYTMADVIG